MLDHVLSEHLSGKRGRQVHILHGSMAHVLLAASTIAHRCGNLRKSGIRLCDRFKGGTSLTSAGMLAYAAMCLRTAGWHPTSSGQGSSYWQDMPQQQHQRIASGTSVSAAAVLQ